MFCSILGSIDQFLRNWVRQSDGAAVTCAPTDDGEIQCLWQSGPQEYFITGTGITWKQNNGIWGTLNDEKDRINWNTGNTWIKQGNILNNHLMILSL